MGIKMNVGLVSTGLVSMLVFKRGGSKAFFSGLGAGAGLGYGWCQNDFFLKDPKLNDALIPKSLDDEANRYWNAVSGWVPSFAKFK